MIASLSGVLKEKDERSCIVEVGGIGFKLFVSATTLAALPSVGERVSLLTVLQVREREGTMELYGFAEERERTLFSLLLGVEGVGPKGALAILSAATVDEIERAIASGDERLLMRVSGIGRKKAQKVLLELQERYEGLAIASGGEMEGALDLIDALKGLGYSEREAREAIRKLPREAKGIEERLKEALRLLGRRT
jgi:Holliday junction DNA helicase RuvA